MEQDSEELEDEWEYEYDPEVTEVCSLLTSSSVI